MNADCYPFCTIIHGIVDAQLPFYLIKTIIFLL